MALTPSTMLELGSKAADFTLPATDGTQVSRSNFDGKPLLVMFICNHCPFVVHIRDHLAKACKAYQEKGMAIVGISANDVSTHPDDGPEKMADEVKSAGYTFPYLYDESQATAKAYNAACTPDFFLYDKSHRLVYRGQYDDSRPDNGVPLTGRDLCAAMDAVLAGDKVNTNQTPSIGCNIKWKSGNEPSYCSS